MKVSELAFSNKFIDELFEFFGKYYINTILILHVLYISVFFGILSINPIYINAFNTSVQLFIGVFLIWRFHPFRSHELKQYDSKIIFGSGIFLLTNLGFFSIFTRGKPTVPQFSFAEQG